MDRPAVVPVGTVGRAHGVKGWVRVRSDMDPAEELLRYDTWLIERAGTWRPMDVISAKMHGNVLVARLDGFDDRDAAALLAGASVGLPREALPALADGQYYWVDLVGLEVVDDAEGTLGTVHEMIETGSNDVMVIRARATAGSGRTRPAERVVPFLVGEVVREVDFAAGRIRISWSPGDHA